MAIDYGRGTDMKRLRENEHGFSLVEVLVVIGLIIILSAIAFPFLGSYVDNRNLQSAAREVMGDFFVYKQRSMAENQPYVITFNVGGNSYTVTQGAAVIVNKTPGTFGSSVRFAASASAACYAGASTSFNVAAISFLTRGTTNPPVGTILLVNNRGSEATITFSVTGKTHACFNLK